MRKLSLLVVAATVFAASAFGLDLKDGRMRLVVDERTGRYALYYLADVAKNRYVPLLYDQETRTTYATLSVDEKTYKLGDASEFRIIVAKEERGARIEYRSSFCVVKQSFAFVSSPGSSMSDGVMLDFSMENVSQKDSSIGLRLLLDTWLGEKAAAHFASQATGPLSVETSLGPDSPDLWIRSSEDSSGASLQVQLSPPATRPDRLVAANWKRLNDAAWVFDANASRNFTLLPYSINDSAIALYYEPRSLRPGATRSISAILSQANEGYAAARAEPAAPGSIAVQAPSETAPLDEMADLVAIRSVLDAIDAVLGSGAEMAPSEREAMESTLRRLEARRAQY